MLSLQIVPKAGSDAYRLLRDKVTFDAKTWSWKNKAKTRLVHKQKPSGFIEVGSADGVLVAEIHAAMDEDTYFLPRSSSGDWLRGFSLNFLR